MSKLTEDEFTRMIRGSIEDDFYLDKAEDESLMQRAAAGGIDPGVANALIEQVLQQTGSAREKALVEQLLQRLRQLAQDGVLDRGEERECLRICEPTAGRKKGLDDEVALKTIETYCSARGVRRLTTEQRRGGGAVWVIAAVVVLAVAGIGTWAALRSRDERPNVPAPAPATVATAAQTPAQPSSAAALPVLHIDPERLQTLQAHLADARAAAEQRRITSPPNGSVLYFVNQYHIELRASDRGAPEYKQLDELRDAVCRQAMQYYCERYQHPTPAEPAQTWKERGEILAGTCRDQELLAICFDHQG